MSLVPDGSITCSCPGVRDSLIDFLFVNQAYLEVLEYLATCLISFDLLLGSDHASLLIEVPLTLPEHSPISITSWKINAEHKDNWIKRFMLLPMLHPHDEESLHSAAKQLLTDISTICNEMFPQCQPPSKCSLPWWNEDCKIAVKNLKGYRGNKPCKWNKQLWITIKNAKCAWLEYLLTDPDTNI
jgi:hypothetical protein